MAKLIELKDKLLSTQKGSGDGNQEKENRKRILINLIAMYIYTSPIKVVLKY